ncbi:MAG TPA: CRISPR system precrRNA processing endoribonuclease RAMP protein Cas6 [Mycobacteriales bacterium]|nr:CRISPR system precrRNA processing endoribonuclease RAMP protein Cas6 [Mycobacteriales bacterium]
MPSRWVVLLRGVDPAGVGRRELHAAVSGWFDAGVEHWASRKPYRVSMPAPAEAGALLEVGLLDDGLAGPLRARLPAGTPVRLGRQASVVGESPRLVSEDGWADLATPSGADRWTLRFDTPTAIRSRARTSPWLAPEQVLASLRDEWRAHAPAGLAVPPGDRVGEAVWVSQVAGHSRTDRLELSAGRTVTVSGFVGQITYRCDDPAVAAAVDPLFRLAPHSGVGGFTAWGYGQANLLPAPAQRAHRTRPTRQ